MAGAEQPGPGGTPILGTEWRPIDLNTALRLAGVQNPDLLVARQRVTEAVALRQFAAVQIIPTLNAGASYDNHTGNLQQSNGNILSVNRESVYVGSGTYPTAAGTVSIPGVLLTGNIARGVYLYLAARQEVRAREFATVAERNQVLLRVCEAYCELIRAEGLRAVRLQVVEQAAEVARITAEYARTGQGREADARRAATFLARRQADVREAEGNVLTASSHLCRLLNLDPSIRLHPTDAAVVPLMVVPEPIPLPELIALALLRRPELAERRAVIQQALLALEGAKVLPFSPTVLIGFSGGGFGGGSNLVNPVFGNFAPRSDFDVFAYWSLLNMGAGNAALIRLAKAQLKVRQYQELIVLDRIRDEVAEAHARIHARFAQIGDQEGAVRSGWKGFGLDLERIRQAVPESGRTVARPIEVLDSLRLLADSLEDYLDAIVDYNRAHFELYVALGQPPASVLARPVPTAGVVPSNPSPVLAPTEEELAEPPAPGTPGAAEAMPPLLTPPPAVRSPFGPALPEPLAPGSAPPARPDSARPRP